MINGLIIDCNKKLNINGIFMDDNQLMDWFNQLPNRQNYTGTARKERVDQ
jgi:hypothetical protein